ncbi:MAG: hypothetical protein GXY03_15475 [Solirubrobacterales bacterium]|nr:hypothetical protein [Solirubrobacterales bacterium]
MNKHRTPAAVVLAAVVAAALAAPPAQGQDDVPDTKLSTSAKAFPSKAGTKKRPRGLKIRASARIDVEPGYEPPIVTGVDILVGRGFAWNADRFVKCTKRTLDQRGPDGCPKQSIMGAAKITARADTIFTHPDMVFVNAGWKRTLAYTTLYRPALVRETIIVKRTKVPGRRWSHRESLRVPRTLQVVAGVPIQLVSARLEIGGKRYARDYIASTSCPRGGWRYRVTAYYLFATDARGEDTVDGSIPCRR